MANKYELQAARIETAFGAYKIPARVWQAKVTPRFVRFDLTTALGSARLTKIKGLDEEIAMSLGAKTVRIYREDGVVRVEVPRETPRTVHLEEVCLQVSHVPPFTGVLGVDTAGDPLLIRLDSPDVAHVLLAGTTGSGKTALLRTLLASLAMHNRAGLLQIVLIDPKGRGFGPLGALPHVWRGAGVIQDPAAALAALQELVREMERRDRINNHLPRIVVAIDELADLLQVLAQPASEAIQRLTQRGREAGLHVVAATQRPGADVVASVIKANFPIRLVGSVVSSDDAEVAAGRGGTRAEMLLGKGDFYLVGKGLPIRFQAAYADSRELAIIVARIRAGGAHRRRWTQAPAGQWENLPLEPAPAFFHNRRPWSGGRSPDGDRTGDRAVSVAKLSPVDVARQSDGESPVTVTTPALPTDASNRARLDALLPPGQLLPMIEPTTPREREILVLAYSVEAGFRPMCRRVYGTSPSGEVRRNGKVRTWLNQALQERTLPAPAVSEADDAVRP